MSWPALLPPDAEKFLLGWKKKEEAETSEHKQDRTLAQADIRRILTIIKKPLPSALHPRPPQNLRSPRPDKSV
jgi:hypothetical protein